VLTRRRDGLYTLAAELVTELPELRGLPFVDFEDLVFGGWDIAPTGLRARARAMEIDDRALPSGLVAAVDDDLAAGPIVDSERSGVKGWPDAPKGGVRRSRPGTGEHDRLAGHRWPAIRLSLSLIHT